MQVKSPAPAVVGVFYIGAQNSIVEHIVAAQLVYFDVDKMRGQAARRRWPSAGLAMTTLCRIIILSGVPGKPVTAIALLLAFAPLKSSIVIWLRSIVFLNACGPPPLEQSQRDAVFIIRNTVADSYIVVPDVDDLLISIATEQKIVCQTAGKIEVLPPSGSRSSGCPACCRENCCA